MSKKLILVLALAFVVGITAAAFAEVQNVKVGGDLTAIGASRTNLNFTKDSSADAWVSVARIKIDANLTDNVDVSFRLLNERAWGGATVTAGTDVSSTEVDVDTAYVALKEFMKDTMGVPVTLVIGRQNVKLGSGLLVGAALTNQANNTQLPVGLGDLSARSSFDAIVSVVDLSPVVLTGAFVKASEAAITAGSDNNVWALNAAWNLGEEYKNAVLEGVYVLSYQKKSEVANYGGRLVVSPMENVGVEAEYVYQKSGTTSLRNKAADAVRLVASLGLPDVAWSPTIALDYERLSKTWNVMHESWVPADLANLLFPNTNCRALGITVAAKPMDAVTLKLRYVNFATAKKLSDSVSWTSPIGTAVTLVDGKKTLGSEVDLALAYDYTADVQFGLAYGMFDPGNAFPTDNQKKASQVVGSMKVSF